MQRTEEIEREASDGAVGGVASGDADATDADADTGGRLAGVRHRIGGLFSIRAFLLTLLLAVFGVVVGGSIPVIGVFGRFFGILAAGFAVGLIASRRRYVEVAAAGAAASAFSFLLTAVSSLFTPFLPHAARLLTRYGVEIAGIGAGAGLIAALVGHYLGRDLRDGLTREVK